MFYYNPPKDTDKFALVACSDWESANSQVEFSEAVFLSDDEFYHFFGYVTRFTNVAKVGDKSWQFTPQLIQFKVARKNYKGRKYDKDSGKWSEIDKIQSLGEQVVCKILANTKEDLFYSGKLQLCTDPSAASVVTGKDNNGDPMPDNLLEMLLAMRGVVVKIPEIRTFSADDVKLPEKKAAFARSSGQKESERLADRVQFICNQLAESGIVLEKCNLGSIYASMNGNETAMAIVEIAKDIM